MGCNVEFDADDDVAVAEEADADDAVGERLWLDRCGSGGVYEIRQQS